MGSFCSSISQLFLLICVGKDFRNKFLDIFADDSARRMKDGCSRAQTVDKPFNQKMKYYFWGVFPAACAVLYMIPSPIDPEPYM